MSEFEKKYPRPILDEKKDFDYPCTEFYMQMKIYKAKKECWLEALEYVKSKAFISNNGSLNGWYIPLETITKEIEELENER